MRAFTTANKWYKYICPLLTCLLNFQESAVLLQKANPMFVSDIYGKLTTCDDINVEQSDVGQPSPRSPHNVFSRVTEIVLIKAYQTKVRWTRTSSANMVI